MKRPPSTSTFYAPHDPNSSERTGSKSAHGLILTKYQEKLESVTYTRLDLDSGNHQQERCQGRFHKRLGLIMSKLRVVIVVGW